MSDSLKCPFCDGDLIWQSDCNANEVSDLYADDDAAVVQYYVCSRCGRDYEIFEPTEEDKENTYHEFWK